MVATPERGRHTDGDGLLDGLAGFCGDFAQPTAGVILNGARWFEFSLDNQGQAARVPDHDIGTLRRSVTEYTGLLGIHAITPTGMLSSQCLGKLRVDDAFRGPGYGRYFVRLLICREMPIILAVRQVAVISRRQRAKGMARRRRRRFR